MKTSFSEPLRDEIFKVITYPGIKKNKYMVSNNGKILNIKTKKKMKTYYDKDMYEKITLVTSVKHPVKRGNKSKHYFIHRLVAWEFLGPPLDEYHNIVNHKDGYPWHNYVSNLEWCSVLENTNHAKKMGLLKNSGVNAKVCKYDEKFIRKICSYFEKGYESSEIYTLLASENPKMNKNALRSLINKLRNKTSYFDIAKEYNYDPPEGLYKCDETVSLIRDMIINNKTNLEILNAFDIKTYKDDPTFYNKIISERAKCKVMFNDYRKLDNSISRNT